jgi:hypothetical protein
MPLNPKFRHGDIIKLQDTDTFVGTHMEALSETNDSIIGPYPANSLVIFLDFLSLGRIKIFVEGKIGWVYDYEIQSIDE